MAQTKTITERDLTELSERPSAPGVAPKSWQDLAVHWMQATWWMRLSFGISFWIYNHNNNMTSYDDIYGSNPNMYTIRLDWI
jgi:hypothetical protein